MGEAKRQRAVMELKMIRTGDLKGARCAWDGCAASYEYKGDGQPPNGWRILYLLRRYAFGKLASGEPALRIMSPKAGVERDCILCPKHAKQLDDSLKPLGRELLGGPAGNA